MRGVGEGKKIKKSARARVNLSKKKNSVLKPTR